MTDVTGPSLFNDIFSSLPTTPTPATGFKNGAATKWHSDAHAFHGFARLVAHPTTPTKDALAGYRYDAKYDLATRACVAGKSLLCVGPTGSGKSTYAQYLAHEMGLPYLEIVHHPEWQPEEIMGRPVQDERGLWVFEDGELVELFAHGGLYNADEIAAIKASVSQFYHPFVNGRAIWVRTKAGRTRVDRSPHFRFFATANPWHRYHGNYEPGIALLDRLLVVDFDYLSPTEEEAVLADLAPSVPLGIVRDLVAFATQWRTGQRANPDATRCPISTRLLGNIVDLMHVVDASLEDAVRFAMLDPIRLKYPDEIDAVTKILRAHIALEA